MLTFPDKKYNIIYADPPWQFTNYSDEWHKEAGPFSKSRWVGNKYSTMSPEEVVDLPIDTICAKDTALFLWVTMPKLREGLYVMEKWGFTYKTCAFTWVKQNKIAKTFFTGMGFWTRSNAEICLLGVKGHPKRVAKNVPQVIFTPIRKHSQKPDEARERIVQLLGDLPRIELFAREKAEGWDSWGLEVENAI